MDSITVGRPIKNRLGAHACHSFLSVPASQTVVSPCTLYYLLAIFASIQFILSFAGGQTGKPFGWTLFVCLYILLIFLFSSLDLEHQCRVRLYITTVLFFFVCFRAPLPPYVLSLPPLPCVLIWKCFGLQRMVMHMTPTVRLTTATIHINIRTSK